jgi:hypothetical protein
MGAWLPWALLVFVGILLVAMPWRRPDPKHEFMLKMLQLLEEDESDVLLKLGNPIRTRTR